MWKRNLLIVFLVLMLIFIWGNSMLPKSLSSHLSEWFGGVVDSTTNSDISDTVNIRKLAHFFEFFALATVSSLLFQYVNNKKPYYFVFLICFGLSVASVDETIQLFNDRGASVTDVLLDFCGYICGVLLIFLILFLIKKKSGQKTCK